MNFSLPVPSPAPPASARRPPRRSVAGRPAARVLAAVCCLLPLAACGSDRQQVAAPRPAGAAARDCLALHRVLPKSLHGLTRRTTSPSSDFTAAWGSPAIVLRCGVPRPALLTPGSAGYDPNAEAADLGGVNWLPQTTHQVDVLMTTTGRQAYVEVTVPAQYTGKADSTDSLTTLGTLVRKTVPAELD
ncbi:DUF3515 domain-containing protein [Streptomyces sp. SL13]|uniref:DUF3515 domain-containing protein n=1 Tax=Streptantibioticus silvisoli TaxID=2705255 RepID=A0AA90K719_9ACTN|nr:DUF3515 domain-containing protein [Streptantibioticus silvisoli]MDI5968458.1 DUF3515 domain-containing protein [Streptantibioticus silvisoli]